MRIAPLLSALSQFALCSEEESEQSIHWTDLDKKFSELYRTIAFTDARAFYRRKF
jgi:hypothetical protein